MIENIHAEGIERVLALRDAYCREDPYILRKAPEAFLSTYAGKLSNDEVFLRILKQDQKDIGYSLLEVDGETGWIREIFVLASYRDVEPYLALLEDAASLLAEHQVSTVRHICPEKPLECAAAFCEAGYELVREHVQMEMPLQEIFARRPNLKLKAFHDFSDARWLLDWVGYCTGNEKLYSMAEIERLILKGDGCAFVAYKGTEPVGFMIAEVNEQRNLQERQQVLYIEQMAVAPGYRMQGIATQMLDLVFRKGMALGLLTARLHVFHDNDAAYRLYEKLGFVEIKRINHWLLELE
jgi:ribosomal protein S18 acetylase RimI-like enzyme